MQSCDRELLGKTVSVMSKDGFICITEAMDALNEKRLSLGLKLRRIDDILQTTSFRERLSSLVRELNINNPAADRNASFAEAVLDIKNMTDLKDYGMAYRKGKGKGQRWFVNPYVFVMIALELDPEIYAKVIIWLTDGLIEDRNLAGEAYIRMCKSVSKLVRDKSEVSDKIRRVAKAVNYVVFNEHSDNRRNFASKSEMSEIVAIENVVTGIIDGGFVVSYDDLITFLGKEWRKKWGNPIEKLR